jgi:hypothetical protein
MLLGGQELAFYQWQGDVATHLDAVRAKINSLAGGGPAARAGGGGGGAAGRGLAAGLASRGSGRSGRGRWQQDWQQEAVGAVSAG